MFGQRYVIGLTGGIGSGKTTVANLFETLGATIIDTDLIAHQLTAANGAAMPSIKEQFGSDFLQPDGSLNRSKMRELVFTQPEQKSRLESILHPLIRKTTVAHAKQSHAPYVLIAIPLLVESGTWREKLQRVLVVDCPEQIQIERVIQRNGLTAQQVQSIMRNQASREQRLQAADDVIVNDGNLDEIATTVHILHQKYLQLSASLQTNTKQHL